MYSFCNVVSEEDGAEGGWVGKVGIVFVEPYECCFFPLVRLVASEEDLHEKGVENVG